MAEATTVNLPLPIGGVAAVTAVGEGLPAPARVVSESRDLVGLPLVQVGDSFSQNFLESKNYGEDATGDRQITFPGIGWRLIQPARRPGTRLPASQILDIHNSLLLLYANSGFPDDGKIYFTRYQLLNLAGWLSPSSTRRGAKVVRPSGRHYRQLEEALTYLSKTQYRNDNPNAFQVGPDGEIFRGSQWFPILQHVMLVEDAPGPRSEMRGPPAPLCKVQFSEPFVKMLARGARAARLDLDLIMSLSTGTPRQLYRVFTWMRQEGIARISIGEMFERLGSTQAELRPARARQILNKSHEEHLQRGVLTQAPEYVRDAETGEYFIQYSFADTSSILSEEEMLVGQARDFGVNDSVSRELVVANRLSFERVLAATVLGKIEPRKTLATMVVHYAQRGYEIADTAQDRAGSGQLPMPELAHPDMRYLAWAAAERQARLLERTDIDVGEIRHDVQRAFAARSAGHADWVVDGIVAIRLNRLLNIPAVTEYHAGERTAA
jgi:hypothetical protein